MKAKIKKVLINAAHKWILLENDPGKITNSLVLGLSIGLIIPMGLQSIVAIPVSLLINGNIIIVITATLISNPLTVVPIYYSAFLIGESLTGLEVPWSIISENIETTSFENWFSLGGDVLIIMITGVLIQGIIISGLAYFIFSYLLDIYFKRKNTEA